MEGSSSPIQHPDVPPACEDGVRSPSPIANPDGESDGEVGWSAEKESSPLLAAVVDSNRQFKVERVNRVEERDGFDMAFVQWANSWVPVHDATADLIHSYYRREAKRRRVSIYFEDEAEEC
jgi:hypothetical protein